MLYSLIIIISLHFNVIYNLESGCGCNVNRNTNVNLRKENFYYQLPSNQCPLEIKYEEPIYSKTVESQMILIPRGTYQVGTDEIVIASDNEGPKRSVRLKSFYLDKFEVSNRDFILFTETTNYKTEAETFGDSFVFTLFLNNTIREQLKDFRVMQAPWWYKVYGANWRRPYGPDLDIADIMDHPVTHVSWNDAKAYCAWRSARLPTEAEWEAGCRGGKQNIIYPWGDKLFPDKKHMANIWQGTFPKHNSAKDGFIGTNPVHLFNQNELGFHNMAGNVWEWTEDSWSDDKPKEKVKKGGSYLCHRSYCYRYRCCSRSHNTDDSSAGNLGFRCAKSA